MFALLSILLNLGVAFFWSQMQSVWKCFFTFVSFILLFLHVSTWRWTLWVVVSVVIAAVKGLFGLYQLFRIMCSLTMLVTLKFYIKFYKFLKNLIHILDKKGQYYWRKQLGKANSYKEWSECAEQVDIAENNLVWKDNDENLPNSSKIILTTQELTSYRESNNYQKVIFALPDIVKRNHLGMDDYEVHARCLTGTKSAVERFQEEVVRCFEYIQNLDEALFSRQQKFDFFQKMSRNLGQSALCLSGGGALSMYHMGVLRALIESGNYKHIRVISGASGGSIVAAMCAIKTEEELLSDVTVEDVSTDFMQSGEMARLGIKWFPPLWRQALNFMRTGFLVDNEDYKRTCRFYYGDITFAEAYRMTRKHVCISVTRRASGGADSSGPAKLLLNHVSTPHVLIRSAVAASCALPGIMAPNDLLMKTAEGDIVSYHADGEGVQFIDGSVQADVPFRRMSALFSVSNFIVSQVNIHVLPFIEHKIPGALPHGPGLLRDVLAALDLDLRHRSIVLSKMGIMPKFYGHDMSSMFKQIYHGNVTIVPQMKIEESLGVKAIIHPSREDMRAYIKGGRKASWPHLRRVKHLLCLEASIWTILETLVVEGSKDFPSYRSSNSISNLVENSDVIDKGELNTHDTERQYNRLSPVMRNRLSAQLMDGTHDVELDGESVCDEQTLLQFEKKSIPFMTQRINELEDENYLLRQKVDQYRMKMAAMGVTERSCDEAGELRQRRPRGLSTCLVPLY